MRRQVYIRLIDQKKMTERKARGALLRWQAVLVTAGRHPRFAATAGKGSAMQTDEQAAQGQRPVKLDAEFEFEIATSVGGRFRRAYNAGRWGPPGPGGRWNTGSQSWVVVGDPASWIGTMDQEEEPGYWRWRLIAHQYQEAMILAGTNGRSRWTWTYCQ